MKPTPIRFVFLLLAAAAFVPAARAQDDKPSGKPPAEPTTPPPAGISTEIGENGQPVMKEGKVTLPSLKLLKAMEEKHGAAKTVSGTFDQIKVSDVFLEEIKSKGSFKFERPDLFRCDYDKPDEVTNLIVKDAIYVYTPALKQAERYKFHSPEERDQQLHLMVLGFGFKADQIVREYAISSSDDDADLAKEVTEAKEDPTKVALLRAIPAEAFRETAPFTTLKIWVDRTALQPRKIWFEDYNGDKTTVSVLAVEFNPQFDPKTFEPKFPDGTEIIDKTEN